MVRRPKHNLTNPKFKLQVMRFLLSELAPKSGALPKGALQSVPTRVIAKSIVRNARKVAKQQRTAIRAKKAEAIKLQLNLMKKGDRFRNNVREMLITAAKLFSRGEEYKPVIERHFEKFRTQFTNNPSPLIRDYARKIVKEVIKELSVAQSKK